LHSACFFLKALTSKIFQFEAASQNANFFLKKNESSVKRSALIDDSSPVTKEQKLNSSQMNKSAQFQNDITCYLSDNQFDFSEESPSVINLKQKADGKSLRLNLSNVSEVLRRQDSEGKEFLQINFQDSTKILVTQKLIGFKPKEVLGLSFAKLPKVVTTPDLLSVLEAIEDQMSASLSADDPETDVLKKIFMAITYGGEAVGFNLEAEKGWLGRLTSVASKASA
jgi:hypothetical protein